MFPVLIMAEAIGGTAGVVALAQLAFESSVAIYQLVMSFKSHNSRVKELEMELSDLHGVLRGLSDHVKATKADVSTLMEITKFSFNFDGTRTSFRDWAKLKYMGDDIDGFRHLLSSYKLTMTNALSDAKLNTCTATAEDVGNYHDLIRTTQEDLRDRLQGMDDKLGHFLRRGIALSDPDARKVQLIRDERLSTEKCLQICAELSGHIVHLQHIAMHSMSSEEASPTQTPGKIYSDGLQECTDSLARTAEKLTDCENELLEQLLDKTRTAVVSDEDRATLSRLRDGLHATRESMAICAKAYGNLREQVATIDNYATGDAIQLMVSINNKPIHGKNRGTGWRTRQLGGYVDKDSVRDAIKSFSSVPTHTFEHDDVSAGEGASTITSDSKENQSQSAFDGERFSLASHL